jgi:hypothetical protein
MKAMNPINRTIAITSKHISKANMQTPNALASYQKSPVNLETSSDLALKQGSHETSLFCDQ